MKKISAKYLPEVCARAGRTVLDHQCDRPSHWAVIGWIASKSRCTGEALRKWVRQGERGQGLQEDMTHEVRDRIKALNREVRELRQSLRDLTRANDMLRKASALIRWFEPVASLHRKSSPMVPGRRLKMVSFGLRLH